MVTQPTFPANPKLFVTVSVSSAVALAVLDTWASPSPVEQCRGAGEYYIHSTILPFMINRNDDLMYVFRWIKIYLNVFKNHPITSSCSTSKTVNSWSSVYMCFSNHALALETSYLKDPQSIFWFGPAKCNRMSSKKTVLLSTASP